MKKKVIIIFFILIIILILTGIDIFFLKNKSQNKPSQNKENNTLYIGLDKVPNDKDFEENSIDYSYIYENPSTDGLEPISEDEAITIWEKYIEEHTTKKDLGYTIYDDHHLEKVEIEDVHPNNHIAPFNWNENEKVAKFTRKAYVIYWSMNGDFDHIEGYVDMYTGEVIGGHYHGI